MEAFSLWPGVWRADATIVSLHYKLGSDQIASILSSSNSEIFITDVKRWNTLKEVLKGLPQIKVVLLDGIHKGCIEFGELTQSKAGDLPPQTGEVSDWAILFFSSGSTGQPKGIVQTHKMLRSLIYNYHLAREAQTHPDYLVNLTVPCKALYNSPLGHGVSGMIICAGLAAGVIFVIQNGIDVEESFRLIERHGVNGMWAVPTILAAFLSHPDAKKYNLGSMKNWITGGAPISHHRILAFEEAFPGRVIPGYGMVESTALVTFEPMDQPHVANSCGKVVPEMKIEIRDPDDHPVPDGETGEICIQGEMVSPGYLDLPEESARTFRDGWLHSGDLGHIDKAGNVFVSGRIKNMIIQGGTNVYPVAVERVLESHPEVNECSVVGLRDSILGERVTAFVSLKAHSKLSTGQLVEYCTARLAAFEVPRQIVLLDSLPRNHASKIDILTLRNWTAPESSTGLAVQLAGQAPSERRMNLSEVVGSMVAKSLGVAISSLNFDEPLMKAGLSSLAAVELSIALSKLLGKRVPETLIFSYPTLNKIIDHLVQFCSTRNK